MCNPLLTLALDMAKRAEDWTHPHKDGTIGRLLDGARYTDEQLCALDIPLPAFTIPSPFQYVHLMVEDDGC